MWNRVTAEVVEVEEEGRKMEKEKSVFIVGIDESKQSFHALEWALDSFFTPFSQETLPYELVILHVKPVASSYVGMAGPGMSVPSFLLLLRNSLYALISVCSLLFYHRWNIYVFSVPFRLCLNVKAHYCFSNKSGFNGLWLLLKDAYHFLELQQFGGLNQNHLVPCFSSSSSLTFRWFWSMFLERLCSVLPVSLPLFPYEFNSFRLRELSFIFWFHNAIVKQETSGEFAILDFSIR